MSTLKNVKAFLTISRAKIQLGTPPHPLLGLILGASAFTDMISTPALLYLALYLLLITFACNINCLYDIDIDKKYKKYMSDAVNTLGKKTVKSMITIEAVAIIIITSYLFTNGYIITSILALSGMIFGYIYSAEPIRVKKRGFL
ncbi:MAG: UbiA family prenyltransferase, partial [Thermoplasmata archaeon]